MTGTNVIRDYAFGGNQGTYDTLELGLTIASAGIMEMGYMAREAGICFVAGTLVLTEKESCKPQMLLEALKDQAGITGEVRMLVTRERLLGTDGEGRLVPLEKL